MGVQPCSHTRKQTHSYTSTVPRWMRLRPELSGSIKAEQMLANYIRNNLNVRFDREKSSFAPLSKTPCTNTHSCTRTHTHTHSCTHKGVHSPDFWLRNERCSYTKKLLDQVNISANNVSHLSYTMQPRPPIRHGPLCKSPSSW